MSDSVNVQQLSARFFTHPKLNRNKSDEAKRPVYDDVEMVEIRFPGDTRTVVTQPAHELTEGDNGEMVPYYAKYAREYEAYKSGEDEFVNGTAIEDVGFLSPSQKAELRAVNVRTVEQLASMTGRKLYRLGPNGSAMQEKAEAFLSRQDSGKAAQENEDLRRRLAELEAKLQRTQRAEEPEEEDAYVGPAAGVGEAASEDEEDGEEEYSEPDVNLETLTADELKAYIRDRTGETPRGNPNRDTLLRLAEEARDQ